MTKTDSVVARESQHTPGQWKPNYQSDIHIEVVESDGNRAAIVEVATVSRYNPNRAADALLIAAAPSLLAALAACVKHYRAHPPRVTYPQDIVTHEALMSEAEQALRLAQGGQ